MNEDDFLTSAEMLKIFSDKAVGSHLGVDLAEGDDSSFISRTMFGTPATAGIKKPNPFTKKISVGIREHQDVLDELEELKKKQTFSTYLVPMDSHLYRHLEGGTLDQYMADMGDIMDELAHPGMLHERKLFIEEVDISCSNVLLLRPEYT